MCRSPWRRPPHQPLRSLGPACEQAFVCLPLGPSADGPDLHRNLAGSGNSGAGDRVPSLRPVRLSAPGRNQNSLRGIPFGWSRDVPLAVEATSAPVFKPRSPVARASEPLGFAVGARHSRVTASRSYRPSESGPRARRAAGGRPPGPTQLTHGRWYRGGGWPGFQPRGRAGARVARGAGG